MRTRAAFLVGAGVGYLVGTPAGRRQIERITARANALLGEDGPWAGPVRARPGGRRGRVAPTAALSSKVVEAARAAARAAAAAAPRIVRPVPPRPSERQLSYRMPAQRSPARDWDWDGDGDGQANPSDS
ncbi:hypothetical protein DDP54_07185 [Cellulomonas sp. WB94]|uniref:hypothetical protein n=1 Tax=Cellulomonas sp. WB94 TaxID=2173174 RepID=UPI000D57AA87|nr:hypothetical protein [Cellulomonas sp. WB94]PVU82823.1 hypothetical protein DDP54_07185 [Cellulomonas sp. WB94]